MKKMIWFSAILVFCCLMISFVIIPTMAYTNVPQEQKNTTTISTEPVYIIVNENNKIVVYDKSSKKMKTVTEAVVNVLPLEDQEKLNYGIEVTGDEALRKALEDYCS